MQVWLTCVCFLDCFEVYAIIYVCCKVILVFIYGSYLTSNDYYLRLND